MGSLWYPPRDPLPYQFQSFFEAGNAQMTPEIQKRFQELFGACGVPTERLQKVADVETVNVLPNEKEPVKIDLRPVRELGSLLATGTILRCEKDERSGKAEWSFRHPDGTHQDMSAARFLREMVEECANHGVPAAQFVTLGFKSKYGVKTTSSAEQQPPPSGDVVPDHLDDEKPEPTSHESTPPSDAAPEEGRDEENRGRDEETRVPAENDAQKNVNRQVIGQYMRKVRRVFVLMPEGDAWTKRTHWKFLQSGDKASGNGGTAARLYYPSRVGPGGSFQDEDIEYVRIASTEAHKSALRLLSDRNRDDRQKGLSTYFHWNPEGSGPVDPSVFKNKQILFVLVPSGNDVHVYYPSEVGSGGKVKECKMFTIRPRKLL